MDIIDRFRSIVPEANCGYSVRYGDDHSTLQHEDCCYVINCGDYGGYGLTKKGVIKYGRKYFPLDNGMKNAVDWLSFTSFLKQCIEDYNIHLHLYYDKDEIEEIREENRLNMYS